MKNKNFLILLLVFPLFMVSCSESKSNDQEIVKGLMKDQEIDEKKAKCLVKKTKPLVEKEVWGKYQEIFKKINAGIKEEPDYETLMMVGILLMNQSKKCGFEWK